MLAMPHDGMPARRTILQAFVSLIVGSCKRSDTWLVDKAASAQGIKWIAFYGESADERVLSAYDLVVLDPTFKGSKTAITKAGARLCGYLSLGEIRAGATFYGRLDPSALLAENPAWPGTHRIDVRQSSWTNLVLSELVPNLLAGGFSGLFLDTLDTPPYLEQVNADLYYGMRQAAIDLVHAIRRANPHMLIIMNRGYNLLPDVVDQIDAVVAESLLTTADINVPGLYKWNTDAEIAAQLSLLAATQQRRPPLPILSLDYWTQEDVRVIKQIYAREHQLGHHPFVTNRTLDIIVPGPMADSQT
jgi:uncharacterized protein (TIGR01370 family)